VGTGLGAFFQHHHRDLFAMFSRELFQTDGSGQTRRAAADHDHVVFHRFSRAILGQDFIVCHGVSRLIMVGAIDPVNRYRILTEKPF
jgi:hypothetical protein